ncbi:hypothetical protein [Geminisphaera colitermitum]|uniref:hypothetical protein n=1 Tax=Geminisphaera colitermitum TaxID=1148786 RepID=UPI0005B817ED|nr:hypothetical protein [Geminisphaera colitermitum]
MAFPSRRLFLPFCGLCLVAGGLASVPLCADTALRHTVELPRVWKVQPATSPEVAPAVADWGNSATGSWKDGVSRQGTSWQSAGLRDIHSLWFEQEITLPADWRGKSLAADFRRIEGDAIIFLNGHRVAELLRPGGEIDLTQFADFGGRNTLRVYLTRNYTGISRNYEQDVLRHYVRTRQKLPMTDWGLGITAPVTLTARSATAAVTDIFVKTSWRKKQLAIEIEIAAGQPAQNVRATATIYDAGNKTVLTLSSDPLTLPPGRSVHTLSAPWADPIPWELDQPTLYTAKIRLEAAGTPIDAPPPVTFGFREIWTEGNQLLMNGHPSRWRLTEIYGANKHGLSLYRLLGYNVGQIQPHGDLWWCGRWASETPIFDEELLSEMDRLGMGVTLPVPSVSYLRENFHKEGVAQAYERETAYHLKKYRNHPSILAWVVAINSYVPKNAIEPEKMGIRETNPRGQAKVINDAVAILHKQDSTRLAFAHADGSTGDISTANTYLNFVPLQEREEWPKAWATQGDMPYSAVEFGAPFSANYWKGKQFLLTEYLAMYLGDQAYLDEKEDALKNTIDYALLNQNGFGKWGKIDLSLYPKYNDFLGFFVRNTNRAWRTWGINAGWLYWLIGERYGHPNLTLDVDAYEKLNYNFLTAPLTEKPSWANANFDIFQQANQPLLVYLAGAPVFTDKTHAFHAGENVKKQIATIWDGAVPTTVTAKWILKNTAQGGSILATGSEKITLATGEIRLTPFSIDLPKDISRRTPLSLELTAAQDGKIVAQDTLTIEVFPPAAPLTPPLRIALHDPRGKSAADLKKLGINPRLWTPGSSPLPPPPDIDLLIIGREAIIPGEPLPWRAADIRDGLRVLVLEQHPLAWRSLGFDTIETMPRHIFARDQTSPLFNGLEAADLINWRGSPDLLPEGEQVVSSDAPHAPKWTNRHAVASVALRTPQVAGFTPLAEAEFDLAYSPLLQWRDGKGHIYFSTLDFSKRIGIDPAATLLARNLIETAATTTANATSTRPVYSLIGDEDKTLLNKLGIEAINGFPTSEDAATNALLIVGRDATTTPATAERIHAFANAGGTVLHLDRLATELNTAGLRTSTRTVYRAVPDASAPLLRGIGPNLLRWQDALKVNAFTPDNDNASAQTRVLADGLILERRIGQGRKIYLQVHPSMLENRHANDSDRREATQLSVQRLHRLIAQLLTNLGATPSPAISSRLAIAPKAPSMSTLGSWRVMGPQHTAQTRAARILGETFPGEWVAIQGAENPNTLHKRADGATLDWRRTIEARKDGFVDLAEALGGAKHGHVAYATRAISSDRDQTVTLLLGVDYWMQVWVNGRSILKVDEAHGTPVPNAFKVKVPLKKGKNIITLKVASGTNGFGFWCQLQTDDDAPTAAAAPGQDAVPNVKFYTDPFRIFDPYLFTYW